MHKSFTLILAVLLVVALAVPCFASEYNTGYDMIDRAFETIGIPSEALVEFDYWAFYTTGTTGSLFIGNAPMYVYTGIPDWTTSTTYKKTWLKFDMQDCYYATFSINPDATTPEETFISSTVNRKVQGGDMYALTVESLDVVYSNHSIYDIDTGEVVFSPIPLDYCTGESCPASDANHDNICDDCGKVLTYNLRSTLLEFARTFAADNDSGYSYWAIFQVLDQYRVYVSKTPIVSPNGAIIEGNDLKYALLYQLDNGSFGYGSWYTGFDVNLTFIEANHTIENFTPPPLAAVIQGVTGEAMKVTLPNLHRTMKILALCGVGCLALWIGLKLFGKRSLLFLKR